LFTKRVLNTSTDLPKDSVIKGKGSNQAQQQQTTTKGSGAKGGKGGSKSRGGGGGGGGGNESKNDARRIGKGDGRGALDEDAWTEATGNSKEKEVRGDCFWFCFLLVWFCIIRVFVSIHICNFPHL
jgi:hypothetical protein